MLFIKLANVPHLISRRLDRLASPDYGFGTTVSAMTVVSLQSEFFAQLAEPFTAEPLFDCLSDLVFFVKNRRGEYLVVNQALVERCGRRQKSELIGRRADEVFPPPFGGVYHAQDEQVLRSGEPILNQLELHFYPAGGRGWCVTNKFPLRSRDGRVTGLYGLSKDLQGSAQGKEDYSPMADAIRRIQTRFDQPLKVRSLAEQAGLSEYQFEQRVRKIFHITPGQLIQKVRMEAAVRRLRDTADAVVVIAMDCGYSDQSAFTRQFRLTTGLSPSEYRRKFQREDVENTDGK